ncbi:MAG: circadian clock protein KaiA [Acaryochloridaceae cyanobacterium RU_4_10]|nr:circadian clock protein KaiA [Acaryochloridaceae cyanobacterium RU_4_10]
MTIPSSAVSRPRISVCALVEAETLLDQLNRALDGDRYTATHTRQVDVFLETVSRDRFSIDCLILDRALDLEPVIRRLHREATLLPAILLGPVPTKVERQSLSLEDCHYHTAEIHLSVAELSQLQKRIEVAIAQFLKLSPSCRLPHHNGGEEDISSLTLTETLTTQQQRLSEKLKERLGYLGIYYKRDPQLFFRNFTKVERESFIHELTVEYQDIILSYFQKGGDINPKIDAFVNRAFFADLSVSQVLELHMELMERFAKKLKLEGRSEDVLLDYRLTLIDVIAHLGEMYRRSIPREP